MAGGATKQIASDRTGRSAETFARIASYINAAISPPKQARPWAHEAGMLTDSGRVRTASSSSENFMDVPGWQAGCANGSEAAAAGQGL